MLGQLLDADAGNHRKTLEGYTIPLLNQYITIILSAIVITYTLYTFSAHPGLYGLVQLHH